MVLVLACREIQQQQQQQHHPHLEKKPKLGCYCSFGETAKVKIHISYVESSK